MSVNGSICDLDGSRSHGDRQFSTASPPRRDVTFRSRCGRSPVRSRLTSAWKLSGQPLSVGPVIRPSPVARNSVPSVLPVESESIHSRTLGLWRMTQLVPGGSFWFGFDVSLAAIRSSPNTSLRGGRSPGSCVTRSYAARTAAPPSQQVFGRGGGASTGKLDTSMVPN